MYDLPRWGEPVALSRHQVLGTFVRPIPDQARALTDTLNKAGPDDAILADSAVAGVVRLLGHPAGTRPCAVGLGTLPLVQSSIHVQVLDLSRMSDASCSCAPTMTLRAHELFAPLPAEAGHSEAPVPLPTLESRSPPASAAGSSLRYAPTRGCNGRTLRERNRLLSNVGLCCALASLIVDDSHHSSQPLPGLVTNERSYLAAAPRRCAAASASPTPLVGLAHRDGGGDFLVLAPLHAGHDDPEHDLAELIVDRVRTTCAVTVSVGIVHLDMASQPELQQYPIEHPAPYDESSTDLTLDAESSVEQVIDQVMHAADEALYAAKAAGRDCAHRGDILVVPHNSAISFPAGAVPDAQHASTYPIADPPPRTRR